MTIKEKIKFVEVLSKLDPVVSSLYRDPPGNPGCASLNMHVRNDGKIEHTKCSKTLSEYFYKVENLESTPYSSGWVMYCRPCLKHLDLFRKSKRWRLVV